MKKTQRIPARDRTRVFRLPLRLILLSVLLSLSKRKEKRVWLVHSSRTKKSSNGQTCNNFKLSLYTWCKARHLFTGGLCSLVRQSVCACSASVWSPRHVVRIDQSLLFPCFCSRVCSALMRPNIYTPIVHYTLELIKRPSGHIHLNVNVEFDPGMVRMAILIYIWRHYTNGLSLLVNTLCVVCNCWSMNYARAGQCFGRYSPHFELDVPGVHAVWQGGEMENEQTPLAGRKRSNVLTETACLCIAE